MVGTNVIRVLVVDDQPSFCHLARHILSKNSDRFLVSEANDASSALRLVQELAPDLVLMDVEMPGTNGLEATLSIRAHCPSVKVIAMSFHEEAEHKKLAFEAGATDFVPKREF